MARSAHPPDRVADLERMLRELEQRVAWLRRTTSRTRHEAPAAFDRFGGAIAAALGDVASRLRFANPQAMGDDAVHLADDALKLGNEALRKLAKEVEHRPLVMLAIAAGVGAIAAGLFARRA